MIRGLIFSAIVLAIVLLVGSQAALWYGRSLFEEPDVDVVSSVTEALDAQRIVLVFAHPDDEITATELISRAVEEGAFVATITATRGEAGTQFPEIVDQAHLGVVREGELRRHGFALGLDEQVVLGLPDGGVPEAMSDAQLAARVLEELERLEPDAVVTFHPPSGVSLHPDHMAMGRAALAATERYASRRGEAVTLAYTLNSRPGSRRFGGERYARVADLQPDPGFALDVDASLKTRAWRIHASQADYLRETTGVPAWLLYLMWNQEYYAVRTIEP
ncbi:PIG-L family deacetylase [Hyphobacterium sp. HN65]|uniref:PIG-L family deacetylase n=1 Tax=Hyphobacterium lacteum TaxID=3116575 RepID=A0ABU7LMN6_9PROT|nr:PIG-L family deacetylase [Hyphobacterium sp. HN65]MEE2525187.1 PIG-L family deacetylase [Hyphobacterium sp. HN65]